MNINESIRQSIQNIPAVQSFLKKRIIRWWNKIQLAPLFLAFFGVFIVFPVCVVLKWNNDPYAWSILGVHIVSVVPIVILFLLFMDILIDSVGARPFIKQAININLGVSKESLGQMIAPVKQEDKLDAINALLESAADRALVENVIALSETDLPSGWWSFLKEAAQQSMPETVEVEPSPEEKLNELLSQAKEKNLSSPVKKQWKI